LQYPAGSARRLERRDRRLRIQLSEQEKADLIEFLKSI
jgi:hypothetical protein